MIVFSLQIMWYELAQTWKCFSKVVAFLFMTLQTLEIQLLLYSRVGQLQPVG